MVAPLQVQIFDNQRLVLSEEFDGAVELGRQSDRKEAVYSRRLESGRWRVVVAGVEEDAVSRKHALLEPLDGGRVRLTNLSALIPLGLPGGVELGPSQSREVPIPTALAVGRKTVRVEAASAQDPLVQGLPEATMAPGRFLAASGRLPALGLPTSGALDVESVVRWLQVIMGVLQTAASSSDFFQSAARAVVDIVGLDSGRVLILEDGDFREAALEFSPDSTVTAHWRPSRNVLGRLRSERKTFWQEPDPSSEPEAVSLIGVNAVVAAPILDRQGEVIGALYGERRQGARSAVPRIARVDAMLMELLAGGVAAGLARVEQEKAALAATVRWEQFVTPELARELAARPDLLEGRDLEVTLLFCDIRGFSRISERLGSAGTFRWMNDVMTAFSDCVLAHEGMIVDILGDEMIAMWGAPKEHPRHAQSACLAALEMLGRLPDLAGRWGPTLGEALDVGVGINTGTAQVGNTGSSQKFQYGALGNTVNLASRVQGATKYLRSRVLVTGATRSRLDPDFPARRLCKVEVVNIAEPVDLYELAPPGLPDWPDLRREYEKALQEFEARDFRHATTTLGNLLVKHPGDGPSIALLRRVVDHLAEEPVDFSPVWKLPGK